VLGAIILIVAAALVVRAVVKNTSTTSQSEAASAGFAAAPAAQAAAVAQPGAAQSPETPAPVVANEPATPVLGPALQSADAAPVTPTPTAAMATPTTPAVAGAEPVPQTASTVIGTEIGAVADLNRLAADQTGVFVFLPSRKSDAAASPKASMEAAARTISAQGNKIGLFTLKVGTSDYEQLAMQAAAPGVLALVKGRGMKAVSGEVTETKLVQAFVAASSAGGGCGPASGGCGPSGCK